MFPFIVFKILRSCITYNSNINNSEFLVNIFISNVSFFRIRIIVIFTVLYRYTLLIILLKTSLNIYEFAHRKQNTEYVTIVV